MKEERQIRLNVICRFLFDATCSYLYALFQSRIICASRSR